MNVAVFVTCLAEAFAPEVADAAARVVRSVLGPEAHVQLVGDCCCGQPAYNAGYHGSARALAWRLLVRLRNFDLVVVPSGSCAAMLLRYYPHLFAADTRDGEAFARLAERTRELSALVAAHLPAGGDAAAGTEVEGTATATEQTGGDLSAAERVVGFHPSCHSLRGAVVGDAGERCLAAAGYSVCPHADPEECCGFGGLFAVKESALSAAMADRKLDRLLAAGASTVVAGELGCLLHLEGRARRRGLWMRFRHLAVELADRWSGDE